MKITIAQLNPTIGDIEGNLQKAVLALRQAQADGAQLLVFPELFLTGYPPRDLLERKEFIERTRKALERLAKRSADFPGIKIIMGAPTFSGRKEGKGIYNSAVLIAEGKIEDAYHKVLLPTYDVFDERRYFDSPAPEEIRVLGDGLGIAVCEDMWNDPGLFTERTYSLDPIAVLAEKGAKVLIDISASPFHAGKEKQRYEIMKKHAQKHRLPFVFVNQVGGQDELIFDGNSMCLDKEGRIIEFFPGFEEKVATVDVSQEGHSSFQEDLRPRIQSVHDALVLGIRDFVKKCGFEKVVVGVSGGIDSALVAVLAAQALGSENVLAVSMPGPYSSKGSFEDAKKLAANLKIAFTVAPISDIYASFMDALKKDFGSRPADTTEENLQARIRGTILMAFSNKFKYMLLSTGNKSEIAVGYCTLYGDMSGGLAAISDIPKTMVYELASYINKDKELIPRAIFEKPPSAELKPNQTDQDTLPPYDVLDHILDWYVEKGYSKQEIIDLKFDPQTVQWVVRAVDRNEYKRRQAAPGLKVTSKAFGMGRRMPIAAKYE